MWPESRLLVSSCRSPTYSGPPTQEPILEESTCTRHGGGGGGGLPSRGRDNLVLKSSGFWDFPGRPVVDSVLPVRDAGVQTLVGELRSHILQGEKKKFRVQCFEGLCLFSVRMDRIFVCNLLF